MSIRENTVIKPGVGDAPISWPHRVLLVDRDLGIASLIALPGAPGKDNKPRTHVTGPKCFDLAELDDGFARNALVTTTFEAPGHWSMTDKEYLEGAPTKKEKKRRDKRLKDRDSAWSIVSEVIGERSVRDIARDPALLRAKVLKQAAKHDVNVTTVYRSLHIYLASGGVRSSLIPNSHLRGAPGRPKAQRMKLGRRSRLEVADNCQATRFVITEQDKERLSLGWTLRSKTVTTADAYLFTCAAFWSTVIPDITVKLHPPNQRPTKAQFIYWGQRLCTKAARRQRIGSDSWAENIFAGSTQDQVCAVGQMAMLDSTSTDIYLTSMLSRQTKLPPMHRTIVKEVRSTAVLGFYVGWENPSPSTALQAVLSSAESKVEICRRFDIEIDDDAWPAVLCKLFLADNGEMKAAAVTDAEQEFRFGIEYTKTYSGQSKSDVENQHHTDHKRLDHKLPGSSRGHRRERGESHSALEALWNYFEYMREFLLMVIEYNNEEVPRLAPTAMLKEGIRPTRINVMKWMMARNMRADIPCNVDLLRAYTLPSVPAVITKTGIRLLMPDGIRHVPHLRFFAPALMKSHHFINAVKNGSAAKISVKMKEGDLGRVWFALPSGLTEIPNVSSEADYVREATLVDHLQRIESDDLRKDKEKPAREQSKLDALLRRQGVTDRARTELETESDALPKKPSKKSVVSELRRKRDEEMAALRSQASTASTPRGDDVQELPQLPTADSSAAASAAMEQFMREVA